MNKNFPLKDYNAFNATRQDLTVKYGETWIFDDNFDNSVNQLRKSSLKNWWMSVLINADKQFEVSLLLFWINFFSIELRKTTYAVRVFRHFDIIRTNAMGNFKEMMVEMILSQTIFHYVKKIKGPDETTTNAVADRILALYTVGPDYKKFTSKEKIKKLRKLLNQLNLICDTVMANPRNQATAPSIAFDISSVLHVSSVKDFIQEISMFLDKLFQSTPVAAHITRKLFLWKNNKPITALDEKYIIAPCTEVFHTSDFDIQKLVSEIYYHPEQVIKTPAEYLLQIFNLYLEDDMLSAVECDNYPFYHWFRHQIEALGQDISDVPENLSWDEYTVSPAQQLWLREELIMKRTLVKEHFINGLRKKTSLLRQ